MKDFVKRMVDEHAQLVLRIEALNDYVYGERGKADDKVEYANKCIQLSAMRTYETALRARLINQGIDFDGEAYHEKVGVITRPEDVESESEEQPNLKDCE